MPTSSATIEEYLREVQVASSRLQYLEEALKMYLTECYRVIALGLRGRLPFRFSYRDVAEQPLGSLVRLFKKHSNSAEIIQLLGEMPKERNYVAHRAYLLTTEEIHDPAKIAPEFKRVRAISEKADLVVKAMLEQIRSVRAIREKLEGDV